ncbi:MAG TPA: amidase [Candidatus Angelobacter sp.]|nr:amidase [Candidatus Angelobacter sp.]
MDITSLSACELAQSIQQKGISPVEAAHAYLRRIEELNPLVNAMACLDPARVLADARNAENALMAGVTGKPLLGVPLTVKACIDVQGLRCEAGTQLRKGYRAESDAPLVARLRSAGAVILGTTSTPEMLIAYHTENRLQGQTRNPWDLNRSPGGSSGGEAAAIACGMSAGGIGSDGGGSIRVPASFCGICGLKPTPGRIPTTGHYPPSGGPFSLIGVVGPMARTVRDLQLLYEVTSGYEPGDPVSVPAPSSWDSEVGLPQALRVGFYEHDGRTSPTSDVAAAVIAAAQCLEDRGFVVESYRPEGLERVHELWCNIFVQGIAMVLSPLVKGREKDLTANTAEFLDLASSLPPLTAGELLRTLLDRDSLRFSLIEAMKRFPILLSPVAAIPAFRHHEGGWGTTHPADYLQTMTYSQYYNVLGNPAAVVPIATSSEGLPIGVQVIGRPYEEQLLFRVAAILEERFGYKAPKVEALVRPLT